MKISDATVLVVDDEPELLEIFSIWLRRSGATVLTAPNGAEALKFFPGTTVHALISDIRMPIMDGLTLVKRLHDMGLAVPSIIFVSGFGDSDVRTLYDLGVEAMLPKPLGRNQLMQALEICLREREELWLEPPAKAPEASIAVDLPRLDEALSAGVFAVGRGGCCFQYAQTLPEIDIGLLLAFATDGSVDATTLEGRGCVRWYDPKTRHVGVEFSYIAPRSRAWLLEKIRAETSRSFIPAC